MTLSFLQTILKPIFGTFESQELKKFLRMGLVFAGIIGTYWTLRPLKNALFCTLVGAAELPFAKTASLILLVPILLMYTKLLDVLTREKAFYALTVLYGIGAALIGLLLINVHVGQAACDIIAARNGVAYAGTKFLAYFMYIFVESFGSLVPALFWAIATDTTMPESAKKGFSLVVALGQFGGMVAPYFITSLPHKLGLETSALSFFVCALTMPLTSLLLKNFLTRTPRELLTSFHGVNEHQEEKKHEAGFSEGLRLLVRHKYLLGIFAIVAFPEILTAIFDLHFNSLAAQHYSGVALANYLGMYASSVNLIALIFLLGGISNITRYIGISAALLLMPVVYGFATLGFVSFKSLNFLFVLMASSKAINYALNVPAIKLLYLPTTHDVRFKAQAWIESFGSRGSKEGGALFGMLLKPLQKNLGEVAGRARHALLSSYLGAGVVIIWLFVALFLGRTYTRAVDEKRVVC